MAKALTEKQLRPITQAWLQGRGYYVAHEVMLCGFCDMIGCRWEPRVGRKIPIMAEIMCVELKIKDIVGVLRQCKENQTVADYSYAAMPWSFCNSMRPQSLMKFADIGVGLMGVDVYCGIRIFIEAAKNQINHHPDVCRRLWNFKLRSTRNKALKGGSEDG